MYQISANTGILAALTPPSTVTPSKYNFNAIMVSINGNTYFYSLNTNDPGQGSVLMYSIKSGLLSPLSQPSIECGIGPSYIISVSIDSNNYIYVLNVNSLAISSISMYSIDNNSGLLTPLSQPSINTGKTAQKISFVTLGGYTYCYVPNYDSNTIAMFVIDNLSGILTPLSPPTLTVTQPTQSALLTLNGSSYYYVTSGNRILMYGINNTGLLIPLSTPNIAVGRDQSNIISVTTSTGNSYMYVSCFNSLFLYFINNSSGILTALSPSSITSINPSYMATVTINGASYLYIAISNSGNKIVSYSINNNTGALTEIGSRVSSIATRRPLVIQNIDGNYYMYVIILTGGIRSDIIMFSISSTGILSAIGSPIYCGVIAQSLHIVSI